MMYNHKLAVALKSAGKVLREFGETIYIPFGSEYSVLIKNLNSVRALVKIEIDGVDVGDGTKFIVDPNSNVELERFIKNSNLKNGNRFKFIERSDSIEQHRGVGVEDGLIRVEFNFEKVVSFIPDRSHGWNNRNNNLNDRNDNWYNNRHGLNGDITFINSVTRQTTANTSNNVNYTADISTNVNDVGITVPGSVSNQQFQDADWFPIETETHVIMLQMLGQTENNQQVTKPVTVKAKPKCVTCGITNKATSKFCTECGTALTIV